jgi:ribosomal protein S18 acetylase RimI-like enzyme
MNIRRADATDRAAIWRIMQPIVGAGETYALPHDMSEVDALAYWHAPGHDVWICERDGDVVGTYYMRANQPGGGAHVANCAYMTAPWATGQGVARAMCAHSLQQAKAGGFRAMQFNFVLMSNVRAVRLWQTFLFQIVGRIPEAFEHPSLGLVDALVMYRKL